MKNSVNGVKVKGEPEFYSYSKVENRSYKDHQIYGPIPFYEILKFELRQNMGW